MISILFVVGIALFAFYCALSYGFWFAILEDCTAIAKGMARVLSIITALLVVYLIFSDILPASITTFLAVSPVVIIIISLIFN